MTTATLTEILSALLKGVDPRTGEQHTTDTCLTRPLVRKSLKRMLQTVRAGEVIAIPDAEIEAACADLRALDYQPVASQLAKVLIGSRSIADPRLRGLPAYRKYRGLYSRAVITDHLADFARRHPNVLAAGRPQPLPRASAGAREAWRSVDFFQTTPFQHLDEVKAKELREAVAALGLYKKDDTLPDYMAQARRAYRRAYEPWTREEQALLVEAMCYTNDLERLGTVFARSTNAIEKMGQRLIYESRQRSARA